MCQNKRKIFVPSIYGYRSMIVNCGHCFECLQEKADLRSRRIKNSLCKGKFFLFVTLTYCDECVPYILKSDVRYLQNYDKMAEYSLPVYRDSVDYVHSSYISPSKSLKHKRKKVNYNFYCGSGNVRYIGISKRTYGTVFVSNVTVSDYNLSHTPVDKLKTLRGSRSSERVGVICYSDAQKFLKRFRQNLIRNYDYLQPVKYFCCAEYGPTTCRPHFHLLIECDSANYKIFKSAIVKAWPYDNLRVLRYVEIARNAASYVSSYVNCHNSVPLLLRYGDVRPKHSFSPSLGFGTSYFSLASLQEQIRLGNLTYPSPIRGKDGTFTLQPCVVPKYVINKYFPKFQGFGRLTSDEVFHIVLSPVRLLSDEFRVKTGTYFKDMPGGDDLVPSYRSYILLRNKVLQFCGSPDSPDFSSRISDYAYSYSRVWQLRSSELLKFSYQQFQDLKLPWHDYYDNVCDYFSGEISSEGITYDSTCEFDFNKKRSNLVRSTYLLDRYGRMDKSRKLKNLDMSKYHNV